MVEAISAHLANAVDWSHASERDTKDTQSKKYADNAQWHVNQALALLEQTLQPHFDAANYVKMSGAHFSGRPLTIAECISGLLADDGIKDLLLAVKQHGIDTIIKGLRSYNCSTESAKSIKELERWELFWMRLPEALLGTHPAVRDLKEGIEKEIEVMDSLIRTSGSTIKTILKQLGLKIQLPHFFHSVFPNITQEHNQVCRRAMHKEVVIRFTGLLPLLATTKKHISGANIYDDAAQNARALALLSVDKIDELINTMIATSPPKEGYMKLLSQHLEQLGVLMWTLNKELFLMQEGFLVYGLSSVQQEHIKEAVRAKFTWQKPGPLRENVRLLLDTLLGLLPQPYTIDLGGVRKRVNTLQETVNQPPSQAMSPLAKPVQLEALGLVTVNLTPVIGWIQHNVKGPMESIKSAGQIIDGLSSQIVGAQVLCARACSGMLRSEVYALHEIRQSASQNIQRSLKLTMWQELFSEKYISVCQSVWNQFIQSFRYQESERKKNEEDLKKYRELSWWQYYATHGLQKIKKSCIDLYYLWPDPEVYLADEERQEEREKNFKIFTNEYHNVFNHLSTLSGEYDSNSTLCGLINETWKLLKVLQDVSLNVSYDEPNNNTNEVQASFLKNYVNAIQSLQRIISCLLSNNRDCENLAIAVERITLPPAKYLIEKMTVSVPATESLSYNLPFPEGEVKYKAEAGLDHKHAHSQTGPARQARASVSTGNTDLPAVWKQYTTNWFTDLKKFWPTPWLEPGNEFKVRNVFERYISSGYIGLKNDITTSGHSQENADSNPLYPELGCYSFVDYMNDRATDERRIMRSKLSLYEKRLPEAPHSIVCRLLSWAAYFGWRINGYPDYELRLAQYYSVHDALVEADRKLIYWRYIKGHIKKRLSASACMQVVEERFLGRLQPSKYYIWGHLIKRNFNIYRDMPYLE